MEDVILVQCDATRGCGAVFTLDMRGSTAEQHIDIATRLDMGMPCPQCARSGSVHEVRTITP